ncbi:MAG: epoxide hydrolase family protein [Caulobacterales bacterium]
MSQLIDPFILSVPEETLTDLKRRLENVRWPQRETVTDWSQGVPLEKVRALVAYWRDEYDWRRCEAMLNRFTQYKTEIDGVGVHFLHIRSLSPNALPLIMTHGWPGSVIEFHKVIGPLTDPAAHGLNPSDAFHLIIPSLPGYGFSDQPKDTGWAIPRIAKAWAVLMQRLGYDKYGAQGGDWGAVVTTHLGKLKPSGLIGVHVNLPLVLPENPGETLSSEEAAMLQALRRHGLHESGYAEQQATRPQTLGYALTDSPVGQAAWIYEKFKVWTDCDGEPENILAYDEMLDNIMLYWLSGTAASAGRLYWESYRTGFGGIEVEVPVGCSVFPREIYRAPRSWAERFFKNLTYWNELDRGGHFAAFEQPALFAQEVRDCFRLMR